VGYNKVGSRVGEVQDRDCVGVGVRIGNDSRSLNFSPDRGARLN
jgi:hypothetical protein